MTTCLAGKDVDFVLKCLDFALKMFDIVSKMLDFADQGEGRGVDREE